MTRGALRPRSEWCGGVHRHAVVASMCLLLFACVAAIPAHSVTLSAHSVILSALSVILSAAKNLCTRCGKGALDSSLHYVPFRMTREVLRSVWNGRMGWRSVRNGRMGWRSVWNSVGGVALRTERHERAECYDWRVNAREELSDVPDVIRSPHATDCPADSPHAEIT